MDYLILQYFGRTKLNLPRNGSATFAALKHIQSIGESLHNHKVTCIRVSLSNDFRDIRITYIALRAYSCLVLTGENKICALAHERSAVKSSDPILHFCGMMNLDPQYLEVTCMWYLWFIIGAHGIRKNA